VKLSNLSGRIGKALAILFVLFILYMSFVAPIFVDCPDGFYGESAGFFFPNRNDVYDLNDDAWVCSRRGLLISDSGGVKTYQKIVIDNIQESNGEETSTIPTFNTLFSDNFDSSTCRWQEFSDESGESGCTNNLYSFKVNIPGFTYVVLPETPEIYTDFVLQVKVKQVEGPELSLYGLVYRYQDEMNYYLFAIRSDGYYSVIKINDGVSAYLLDWLKSDFIKTGLHSTNNIGVAAKGTQILFLINSTAVDSISNEPLSEGYVGLSVGTFPNQLNATVVHFDEVQVFDVEQ